MFSLAIIPARKGSTRLQNKNIKNICGKPLIAWTIESARNSKIFEKIIVSTDDEKIAKISSSYGAEIPFIRPKNLSDNYASSIDVVKHSLEYFKYPKNFALLQPTSPLRTEYDLKKASNVYFKKDLKSLVSIVEGKPIQWAFYINTENKISSFVRKKSFLRSEFEKNKVYYPNGAIYFSDTELFIENNSFISKSTYGFIMETTSSIDIDTLEDFKIAELILENKIQREHNV